MSNHARLALHLSEESVALDATQVLKPYPTPSKNNPITEYFATANNLARKITRSEHANDSEILGLLLLGVVSGAEFYFRSVLGATVNICPLCKQNTELLQVPIASFDFYEGSGYSSALGTFEHESLADARKIRNECKRFTGFELGEDSSVAKAIQDFEILCELRHCLVHASGFAGLKACRTLGAEQRSLQKLVIDQRQAFELMKLSHNAVRAFNRFLADSILNRWVDRDVFTGKWKSDKPRFSAVVEAFWIKGEDQYGAIAWNAYRPFQKAVLARKRAMATRVAPGTSTTS